MNTTTKKIMTFQIVIDGLQFMITTSDESILRSWILDMIPVLKQAGKSPATNLRLRYSVEQIAVDATVILTT